MYPNAVGDRYPNLAHRLWVLQLPSGVADLNSPVTAPDVQRYIQSPGVGSIERIKLSRLAWDISGSEFAGRHQQYEIFYAGAPFVVRGVYTFHNFGYDEHVARLDEFLATYGTDAQPNRTATTSREV
ncbi:4-hydroxyphenylacetate 3-hydroxylase C-terminal domain-containing protein [Phytoactinopolyspora limicola]|uniref:4-hydroxyphenylacetate 3-hydroxylase C-terminal domain-containing protein n=1 Tax=Phytoactinopolyspora limicola TaxID=2715536 RepID=UPI0024845673|nr:4-hydroxyphenylacetate 3-hydroxylase C-terminal domain-containing protein [Phytoactinopolyspora limicola]